MYTLTSKMEEGCAVHTRDSWPWAVYMLIILVALMYPFIWPSPAEWSWIWPGTNYSLTDLSPLLFRLLLLYYYCTGFNLGFNIYPISLHTHTHTHKTHIHNGSRPPGPSSQRCVWARSVMRLVLSGVVYCMQVGESSALLLLLMMSGMRSARNQPMEMGDKQPEE